MRDYFCAAQEEGEKLTDALCEAVSDLAQGELYDILDEWHQRYPRHSFRAFQGHGMLQISVRPPIGRLHGASERDGWSDIDRIPINMRRGAIRQLYEEADRVLTFWDKLEWRVGTRDMSFIIAPEAA